MSQKLLVNNFKWVGNIFNLSSKFDETLKKKLIKKVSSF